MDSVTNIFLAVARKISRPQLAISSTDEISLRFSNPSRKPASKEGFPPRRLLTASLPWAAPDAHSHPSTLASFAFAKGLVPARSNPSLRLHKTKTEPIRTPF